jgi:hypothetical protein
MKKIYRVYAHDTNDNTIYSSFYTTDESKADFIEHLRKDHDFEIVIDDVIEYSIDDAIDILNLYLE